MQASKSAVAQKLLEAFVRMRRLGWKQSPVAGLTIGETIVLSCIKRAVSEDQTGIKVSDLSSLLNVASPTITQQITSLETRGFVSRKMDREDRRAVRITLTGKGEGALAEHREAFLASINGLVEYLGEEDSDKLADLLGRVFTYFHEVRQPDAYRADKPEELL
jgi:DNA-binding MarR family transcriptional regulator